MFHPCLSVITLASFDPLSQRAATNVDQNSFCIKNWKLINTAHQSGLHYFVYFSFADQKPQNQIVRLLVNGKFIQLSDLEIYDLQIWSRMVIILLHLVFLHFVFVSVPVYLYLYLCLCICICPICKENEVDA